MRNKKKQWLSSSSESAWNCAFPSKWVLTMCLAGKARRPLPQGTGRCWDVVNIFPTTNFQTMRMPKHPACSGWDNLWVCTCTIQLFLHETLPCWGLVEPLLLQGLLATNVRVSQAAYGISCHLRAVVNKDSPNQPPCFKDISLQFCAAEPLLSTYVHSTFNHGEAWDSLERKFNIINFYFRAKEIKTQERDLPMVNYRDLEPTQLQQCPVYRTVSMLKVFFKVYNHNKKQIFFLTAPHKPSKNKDPFMILNHWTW